MNTSWHILTGEYPPVEGGVGDYTFVLANELAKSGDEVHVWCRSDSGQGLNQPCVAVHPAFGRFLPVDLLRAGRLINREPMPRRLLIQWVPHAFGLQASNVPFCVWILIRSVIRRDVVELMVHEPFLPIGGSVWQKLAAIAQRVMMAILLLAASRVWVSQQPWWERIRPFALGRRVGVGWLPVPSNVSTAVDKERLSEIRSEQSSSRPTAGHFGLFGGSKDAYLIPYVEAVLDRLPDVEFRLVGFGSTATRDYIVASRPEFGSRIVSIDGVDGNEVACQLSACDVLVQPYIDGIGSRRGSAMAGLALGLAIVTHTAENSENLWEESGAVVLASPAPEEYAAAVASILTDDQRRAAIAKRAADMYDQRFHIRHVATRLRKPIDTGRPEIDPALLAAADR